MAETEQRFILRARSRNIGRFVGYPIGLGLLVFAVPAFAFGDASSAWAALGLVAFCFGLPVLLWTWSRYRRCRIEVTGQKLTVVNTFSRYAVPWRALVGKLGLEEVLSEGGSVYYNRLAFDTPTMRIVATVPAGSRPEMMGDTCPYSPGS